MKSYVEENYLFWFVCQFTFISHKILRERGILNLVVFICLFFGYLILIIPNLIVFIWWYACRIHKKQSKKKGDNRRYMLSVLTSGIKAILYRIFKAFGGEVLMSIIKVCLNLFHRAIRCTIISFCVVVIGYMVCMPEMKQSASVLFS